MKKLLTLLCSAGLLFTMAACSGSKVQDEALDALETSLNKIVEMKTATYSMGMDVKSGEETASIKVSGGYLADTANPSLNAVVDMESQGQKMEGFMKLYLKDGVVYYDMMGMKGKDDTSDIKKEEAKFEKFNLKKDEIKPYLKKAELKGDSLVLELDTDKLNEVAKKAENSEVAATANVQNSTISKFNLTATRQDDFITKAVLDFEGTQKNASGKDEPISGKITLEFNDINKGKALTFPDFSDYKEVE